MILFYFLFQIAFWLSFECKLEINRPIYIFKRRGHAHERGRVVGIFYRNSDNEKWQRIFENDITKDNDFHDMDPIVPISSSGKLAVRCIYNTTEFKSATTIGVTHANEMCLGQFMFYSEGAEIQLPHCYSYYDSPILNRQLPEPVITKDTIPSRPLEEEKPNVEPTQNYNESKLSFILFNCAIFLFLLFMFPRRKALLCRNVCRCF